VKKEEEGNTRWAGSDPSKRRILERFSKRNREKSVRNYQKGMDKIRKESKFWAAGRKART